MIEPGSYERIKERIAQAARRAGRAPGSVRLIAVSKTQPVSAIERLAALGQTEFGESRMQEAETKILAHPELCWHCIGHVQSNKTRLAGQLFEWVHTIDSVKVFRRIGAAAEEAGREVQALLQVNVARDPAKQGVDPDALFGLLNELFASKIAGIRLRGLMTIGALEQTDDETRRVFAQLRTLADACAERFGSEAFEHLSMGMSGDFEIAIEQGATMVRVGTALFGERH